MVLSLKSLIKKYKSERYVSLLIVGDAGFGKSKYIKDFIKLVPDLRLIYFDIIDEYDKVKTEKSVLSMNPKSFIDWIMSFVSANKSSEVDAVIIDNYDFLFNIWNDNQKAEFFVRISKNLEKAICPVPVLFVMQYDSVIEKLSGLSNIYEFKNLETL